MDSFAVELFSLFAICILVILLRTYARVRSVGFRDFRLDDYLMFPIAVIYGAQIVLAFTVEAYWHGLSNSFVTDRERSSMDPNSNEYSIRINGSKTLFASWSIYVLLLWLLKCAMCTFYLRLTDGLDYTIRINIGYGIIGVSWIAVQLSLLLSCLPIQKNWQIYPDPGNVCQPAVSHINIVITAVLDVATNLYIIYLPIPILWRSSLKPLKKIGLMALFSGGIFVVVGSILRGVLLFTHTANAAEQGVAWACRETFVAIITTNFPMLIPLIMLWATRSLAFVRAFLDGTPPDSKISSSNTITFENKNPRKGLGAKSPYPLPAFSESEERIYAKTFGSNRSMSRAQSPAWSISVRREIKVQIQSLNQKLVDESAIEEGSVVDLGDYYLRNQVRPESSKDTPRMAMRRESTRSLTWSTWSDRTGVHREG